MAKGCKYRMAKALQPIVKSISKKLYVKLQYRFITGHKLSFTDDERYTAKLQYLRLFVFPKLRYAIAGADRAKVRELVKEAGFADNLIPIYGIYDRFADIPWSELPEQFVIKCTHASSFNHIVLSKKDTDVNELKKKFERFLKTDYGKKTVEPHYSKITPRIIIEKYIGSPTSLPVEYKIHVFNGVAKYIYIVTNRGVNIRYSNFYIDGTPFPGAQFNHWKTADPLPPLPSNFAEMVKIAEKLGKETPFVRVDLYNIANQIYFGELTFTPAKGTLTFADDQADKEIGQWLDISAYRH